MYGADSMPHLMKKGHDANVSAHMLPVPGVCEYELTLSITAFAEVNYSQALVREGRVDFLISLKHN